MQHAAGGSLMLDEIAEMPVELQPKLLRVLQERSYRKIGSEKTYAVDFRLISSTNRPPADAIRDGLLARRSFLSHLDDHHSRAALARSQRRYSAAYRILPAHVRRRNTSARSTQSRKPRINALRAPWPGNVRELQNVIERAVLLAKGSRIEPVDLPFDNGSLAGRFTAGRRLGRAGQYDARRH